METRPTAKKPSAQRLRDEMGARRGESTASWFQRGMHITAYKTLLTVPQSPGVFSWYNIHNVLFIQE